MLHDRQMSWSEVHTITCMLAGVLEVVVTLHEMGSIVYMVVASRTSHDNQVMHRRSVCAVSKGTNAHSHLDYCSAHLAKTDSHWLCCTCFVDAVSELQACSVAIFSIMGNNVLADLPCLHFDGSPGKSEPQLHGGTCTICMPLRACSCCMHAHAHYACCAVIYCVSGHRLWRT